MAATSHRQSPTTSTHPIAGEFLLQGMQSTILTHFKSALFKRNEFYSSEIEVCNNASDTNSDVDDQSHAKGQATHYFSGMINVDWRQYVLITGKPGCGKTHTLIKCLRLFPKLLKKDAKYAFLPQQVSWLANSRLLSVMKLLQTLYTVLSTIR